MKKIKTDNAKTFPDALLSEMPIEPRESFADRVLEHLADHSDKIENALKAMPVEPESAFIRKTLDAVEAERKTIRFRVPAQRFIRELSAAAAILIAAFGIYLLSPLRTTNELSESQLAKRISQTVQSDPELYALTQTEEPSFDELLEASKILVSIDPSTLEIFAYND